MSQICSVDFPALCKKSLTKTSILVKYCNHSRKCLALYNQKCKNCYVHLIIIYNKRRLQPWSKCVLLFCLLLLPSTDNHMSDSQTSTIRLLGALALTITLVQQPAGKTTQSHHTTNAQIQRKRWEFTEWDASQMPIHFQHDLSLRLTSTLVCWSRQLEAELRYRREERMTDRGEQKTKVQYVWSPVSFCSL